MGASSRRRLLVQLVVHFVFFLINAYRQPKEKLKTYFLSGVLCGLALYNQNVVHLPFPLVLFKKLLRSKPSLDDMREFDPALAE